MGLKMNRIFVVSVAALSLTGCATPYQEQAGMAGLMGGVKAVRMDETTLQVTAKGNAYTSQDTIALYVMRKAAEATISYGYDGFVIVDQQNRSRRGVIVQPGVSNTTATVNSFGGTATGYATTTYTPGFASTYIKPGEAAVIKMFKGPKPDLPSAYNAQDVLKYMIPATQK